MDYEPIDDAQRVNRRQQVRRDTGANRRDIESAVRDHQRSVGQLIAVRSAGLAAANPSTSGNPVATDTVVIAGASLSIGAAENGTPPAPGSSDSSGSINVVSGDAFIVVTPSTSGGVTTFTITLNGKPCV